MSDSSKKTRTRKTGGAGAGKKPREDNFKVVVIGHSEPPDPNAPIDPALSELIRLILEGILAKMQRERNENQ